MCHLPDNQDQEGTVEPASQSRKLGEFVAKTDQPLARDLEWNGKDRAHDRNLYAFMAFNEAGATDAGVIIICG